MKNIFLGLMLFAVSAFSFSQEVVGEEKKISYRELNDSLSKVNIKLLKEGALLVRLQTKSKMTIWNVSQELVEFDASYQEPFKHFFSKIPSIVFITKFI